VIVFVLLELLEFFVEVTLQLKDYFFDKFNLSALSLVPEKIMRFIKHLIDILAIQSSLQVINRSFCLDYSPVNFFHSFNITTLAFVCERSKSCLFIWVSLTGLIAKLTLSNGKDRL